MPTYSYKCFDCGHQFEETQKMSDPPINLCPACGKTAEVKRLISATAFHLKGSGWYKTDYASKAGGNGSGSSEASSDSKPAETKSEAKTGNADAPAKPAEPAAAPSSSGASGSVSGSSGGDGGGSS